MTARAASGGVRTRPGRGTLADVLDKVLDKGIVVEAWTAVSLLGLEILSLEAQVVVVSVETYLKYAEAISSVNLPPAEAPKQMPVQVSTAEERKPSAAAPKALAERPRPAEHVPSEDELIKYLGEHAGGLRIEQIADHFHAQPEELEEAVAHLVDEHRLLKDQTRDLFLPAFGKG